MKTEIPDTNMRWRQQFSKSVGGYEFDAPGGGYSFSAVLAEERELEKANVKGEPSSALLKLSVADPTWKIEDAAFSAGADYFARAWNASRYTDLAGVRKTEGTMMLQDTNVMVGDLTEHSHEVVMESGKNITADWVQYSPGSIKRALAEYIPTLLFGANSTLLFPSPSYQVIASPMNLREAEVVNIPLSFVNGKWSLPMKLFTEAAEEHIRKQSPGALVMYVNIPHNPTGMGYTRTDWEMLIEWACRHNVTLIVDEAYIDLCYRKDIVSVLQVPGWERCCIVLQSVSKGWNATGLRFGWIVAHPTVIKALRKVMDVKDSGMFGPSIVAGVWCLLHQEIPGKTRARYEALHRRLAEGLQQAGFAGGMPDAGLCQLTPAPKAVSGATFALSFKDAAECARWFRSVLRISVMHAEADGKQWLRWAVTLQSVPECGLPTEDSIIEEAVRRLQSVKFVF